MEDRKEFERFFREYYSRLYYFAYQMVKDDEVCRDILGESFAQLWKYHTTLKLEKYYSYISQIVFNKAIDQKRRWAASNRYADFYRVIYADAAIELAPELSETEQRIQRIYELMDQLTPQTRKVLELCYFKDMKYSETAEKLGISVSAVKKHLVQALKLFREDLLKNTKK